MNERSTAFAEPNQVKLSEHVVFVVDDDSSLLESLDALFRSVGLQVRTFPSAGEFLLHPRADVAACLVLDVRLPVLSGLDLQRLLTDAGEHIPIVFITGHGDVPMSVGAMKAGAAEFLPKPFREQDLLDAVRAALDRAEASRAQCSELKQVQQRYASLTPREREVMTFVVRGLSNKQIAGQLNVREATVKVHRHNTMVKMRAKSLPDLVRKADKLA
jgi:FixJ family two-component response regulator